MNSFLSYFTKTDYEKIKAMDNMYEKAKIIVQQVFGDKVDKNGDLYLNHLYYVSSNLNTMDEKITGLLHSIIEDTNITRDDLEKIQFSDDVVEAVSIITKKSNESNEEHINRVINSNNSIVLNVKKIDIENSINLDKDNCIKTKTKSTQYKKVLNAIERRKK